MKVELAPTITNQKTNLFTKIKRFFVGKLKPLTKDTFEKDRNNTIAKRALYYPEDLKKMETMTEDETILYKRHLDKIGRFYYDDNYHIDTPALDRVTKEYGVDLSKFIIKDKK